MLKANSKEVTKNDIFIALKGENHDGHDYIEDAIQNGASQIIAEHGLYSVETLIVKDTKEYIKKYVERYKEEISDLYIIGMTGTNGKTTTCYLLYQALNNLGKKCAYIGTIGFYIGKKIRDLKNTTPGILDIYEMLLEAKKEGCLYVVMEVSSHALAQDRVYGIEFDVAIISNITRDHLDYHKTMEEYAFAKQKLFYMLKKDGIAIIPEEIDYKSYFMLEKNHNITYGKKGNYKLISYDLDMLKTKFTISHDSIEETYEMKLLGLYNIYNMMNVIIVLDYLGILNKDVIAMLTPPPGRMEMISYETNQIIIDYAHTPDAVQNIVSSIKILVKGKIYVIIGCGGNRDKEKRPMMAKIATELADYVIFTSDNPRDEKPEDIIHDMIENLDATNYEIEINREKAIIKGIQKCIKNDILLILGKGHENYQIIKNEKLHFDDKEIVLGYCRR